MRRLSFLDLPAELRNEVYAWVWESSAGPTVIPVFSQKRTSIAEALLLDTSKVTKVSEQDHVKPQQQLQPLLICRQIRDEASQLALGRTHFNLHAASASPDVFFQQISPLPQSSLRAIRTLTLTAKISQLRALNEAWQGLPFGHPCLQLDLLIITAQKPDASGTCYAEVADHSQCHTLAYVLAETLKSLRNVRQVEVRNARCFRDFVWRLLYRLLVYRMWKWGGSHCGLKFISSDQRFDGSGVEWFRVFIGDEEVQGHEVGAEVCRLMGDGM